MSPQHHFTYLHDCNNREEAKLFFGLHGHERTSSDITPVTDATLALRKLRPTNPWIDPRDVLRPEQIQLLREIVEMNPSTWDSYCDALSIEQIRCVGW